MNYFIQINQNTILSCSNIPVSDVGIKNVEVTKDVFDEYINFPDKFYVENGVLKEKTPQEYSKQKKKERETEFQKDFFPTSLGYIRRQVSMKNGIKDFLSDLLPAITKATEMGMITKVIAYDKPPFDKDVEDWTKYQHNEVVTKEFIQECMLQLQADFGIIEVHNG